MIKEYITGYSGHIPRKKFQMLLTERISKNPGNQKCIPGYSGHIFAMVPENLYGRTFTVCSKEAKDTEKYRNERDYIDDNDNLVTIQRESYKNPKKQDITDNIPSTLQIESRPGYRRRLNSDMIDSDNVLAIGCRDRMKKNIMNNNKFSKTIKNEEQFTEFEKQRKKPIVGYSGHYPQLIAGGIHGNSWSKDRKNAYRSFLKTLRENGNISHKNTEEKPKEEEKKRKSFMDNEKERVSAPDLLNKTMNDVINVKKKPINGYGGHIRFLKTSNIVGVSEEKSREMAKCELELNEGYKDRYDKENREYS